MPETARSIVSWLANAERAVAVSLSIKEGFAIIENHDSPARLMMKKFLLAAYSLILLSTHLSAQNIDSLLSDFSSGFPTEKVYIHYDKQGGYLAGETIWFKGYLYSNGKPSGLE